MSSVKLFPFSKGKNHGTIYGLAAEKIVFSNRSGDGTIEEHKIS